MDIVEIKSRVLTLRELLRQEGIPLDGAVLFGSRAKGTHRPDSDIDLAIISRAFGRNRFDESVLLNRLVFQCIPFCDAVPVGTYDYLDPHPVSPILAEIKATGTPLI